MTKKTMDTLIIGENIYEIVDEAARVDIEGLKQRADTSESNIETLQQKADVAEENINQIKQATITPDTTLGIEGAAADSKVVGDAINELQNSIGDMQDLIGNKSVSEQIEVATVNMLSIDITDAEQSNTNLINADSLGGILPSDFVLDSELDIYKSEISNNYLLKTGTATDSNKFSGYTFDTLKSMLLDFAHPIGSYYWSSDSTNPSNLFGGTWKQIKDRFVLAAGSSYSVGATGGAATVTLTINQIPEHTHAVYSRSVYTGDGNHIALCNESNSTGSYVTGSKGGGEAHNNMPPYIVAYCWCRTA